MPDIAQADIDSATAKMAAAGAKITALEADAAKKDADLVAVKSDLATAQVALAVATTPDPVASKALEDATAALDAILNPAPPPPPAPDNPVATPLTLQTTGGAAIPLPFAATDTVNPNEAFTFAIVQAPTLGLVTDTGSGFTYTPAAAGNGSDTLTYTATGPSINGAAPVTSAAATVSISNEA